MTKFTWDATGGDWTTKLADAISMAGPGDTIRVNDLDCVYLHGPDDDSPYDVDGVPYCGRCHHVLVETETGIGGAS